MSRNSERTGARHKNVEPPQQVLQNSDIMNALNFVVPTEFVVLPSGGRYYPPAHPLHKQETIEIRHMTTKEEDLLTSRALIKKGIVLDRLLDSVIINKSIRASELLVGDRNAIIVSARISGYGADYTTKVTCPSCGTVQDHDFDLNNLDVYNGDNLLEEHATLNDDGTFTTTLPVTKLEINFKLLNGYDEKNLLSQLENARKSKSDENLITRQLKTIVASVNGDSSQETINYVINNIPSMDARHLRYVNKLATPNIDMTQHFECQSCGYEQELEVPLTADFFWPDR